MGKFRARGGKRETEGKKRDMRRYSGGGRRGGTGVHGDV